MKTITDIEEATELAYEGELDLSHCSSQLQDDYDLVELAVRGNGMNLQFASITFQNDWEIVSSAVIQDGRALQFASMELRDNRDIVRDAFFSIGACRSGSSPLQFASEKLKDDFRIGLESVDVCPSSYYMLSEALQKNKVIAKTAVLSKHGSYALRPTDLHESLFYDPDFVKSVLDQFPLAAFELASEDIRRDEVIVKKAILLDYRNMRFVPLELFNNRDFTLSILNLDYRAIVYLTKYWTDDKIVFSAICNEPIVLKLNTDLLEAVRENRDLVERLKQALPSRPDVTYLLD